MENQMNEKPKDYYHNKYNAEYVPYQEEIPMDKEEILKAYKELHGQAVCLTKAVDNAAGFGGVIAFTGTIFLGSGAVLAAATSGLIALANTKPMIVNNFEQSISKGVFSVAGVVGGSVTLLGIGALAGYGLYKGTVWTKYAIENFIFSRKYLREKKEETRSLFNRDIEKIIVKK